MLCVTQGPGTVVAGRYTLEAHAGTGGMARVWRARTVHRGEPVALKRMLDHLRDDPAMRALFADEALTTAALQHPNVVRYIDCGSDAAGPWLALEWIDGLNAQDLLDARRAPLAPGATVSLGLDLLAALAAVHGPAVGVIHRDVSPANVMVGRDGGARLADFGLARSLARSRASATGTARGKIGYLAPEVLNGALHGTRADLYGAGVVLWELLAGRRLFAGVTTRADLARAYLTAPRPSLRSVNPAVPAPLAAVIDRALSLEPSRRHPTAMAMAEALDASARVSEVESSADELAVAVWGALTLHGRNQVPVAPPVPGGTHRAAPVRSTRIRRRVLVMGVAMEVA